MSLPVGVTENQLPTDSRRPEAAEPHPAVSAATGAAEPALEAGAHATAGARVADFIELTKPRITAFVVMTAFVGYMMGNGAPPATAAPLNMARLLNTLVGTGLVASGSSALNMYLERHFDRLMRRTARRPLPSGRMTPTAALAFGVALSSLGVLYLALTTNLLTAVLAVATLASYVFIYTPSKRTTNLSTIIGAVPGALPPVGGWAAATGTLAPGAWALFAVLFAWQLPHFLAIAWMYREDYGRAGYPMLPVTDRTGEATGRQMILWCLGLVPISLAPTLLGMAGHFYWVGALLLSGLFLFGAFGFYTRRDAPAAKRLFLVSIAYLPLLYALLIVNKTNLWK